MKKIVTASIALVTLSAFIVMKKQFVHGHH